MKRRREGVTGKRVEIACSRRRCCPNLPFMNILCQLIVGYLSFSNSTNCTVVRTALFRNPISWASVKVTVNQSSGWIDVIKLLTGQENATCWMPNFLSIVSNETAALLTRLFFFGRASLLNPNDSCGTFGGVSCRIATPLCWNWAKFRPELRRTWHSKVGVWRQASTGEGEATQGEPRQEGSCFLQLRPLNILLCLISKKRKRIEEASHAGWVSPLWYPVLEAQKNILCLPSSEFFPSYAVKLVWSH